ncbi:MAG: PKD domain-containing protein [Gammaproteobacteria bacterium]|nr:PKD domain-containing protein [Gammaproteobacteria bacterium]
MRHIGLTWIPGCVFAALLSACGGGGGGSSPPPPVPPSPPTPPANVAPVASFTVTPTSGSSPLEVVANAGASSDSDGTITAFQWNFGNGTSAIGSVAGTTYTTNGSFTVSLTVTDDDGATATTTRLVTVNAPAGNVTLSGTIQILPSSAIDSDTNDRFTTNTSNNGFANAQTIANPVTLGGFANRPNTGPANGNLSVSGDPGDFYRVSLTGDDLILLTVGESGADLDMRLYDVNRTLLNTSQGNSQTESFSVNTPGTYFIEVFPFSGASNYILTIGKDADAAAALLQEEGQAGGQTKGQTSTQTTLRLSSDFVPGEIIVDPVAGNFFSASTSRLRPFSPNNPGITLFAVAPTALLALNDPNSPGALPQGAVVSTSQRTKLATLNTIKGLRQRKDVEVAEPNFIRRAYREPNDQFYNLQWHYRTINLPLAWDVTTGSSEVIVAVIDTGVLLSHPDLDSQLVPGFDFISSASRARDGNGIDNNPNDEGDGATAGTSSFHGTHVAGTIAAQSNNSQGVAGVSWNARIMPLRALGVNGGTTYDVIQAVRFAAGLSNDSDTLPTRRADIINLSLGSDASSQSEQNTINEARAAGVIVIAAAGNEATTLPSYPAAYSGVTSVSATTISNSLAGYSNRGSTIDIAAPGGNNGTDINGDGLGDGVVSTIGEESSSGPVQFRYASLNGTSMAAPHVAGVAALMKAVHRNLTPTEFDTAITSGRITDDLGIAGRDDQFGFGLINAQRAIAEANRLAAGQGLDPGPVLSASVSTLNFGAFLNELPLQVSNLGTGSLTIAGVTASQPWITITPPNGGGLGTYIIRVTRSGLADSVHTGTITFDGSSNDVTVTVILQISSVDLSANAGLHFVILVDNNGNSNIPAVITRATNGEYTFTINNVPNGEYRIFAGTDSDNDDFLCDAAEACGAYPTLDRPERLSINANRAGLVFLSGFRLNLDSFSVTSDDGMDSESAQIGNTEAGYAFIRPQGDSPPP